MPEERNAEEPQKGLADKLNSRKFLVSMFGMLINAALMILGLLDVKTGIQNVTYFGFGYLFAEGMVDFGRLLGGSTKVAELVTEAKKLIAGISQLKSPDGAGKVD